MCRASRAARSNDRAGRDGMIEDRAEPAPTAERQEPERRRTPLTIRDVARAAGVSVGTVSKALNNNGRLRQETRKRVIAVASELGFRPNDLAQSLHRGQSLTVG